MIVFRKDRTVTVGKCLINRVVSVLSWQFKVFALQWRWSHPSSLFHKDVQVLRLVCYATCVVFICYCYLEDFYLSQLMDWVFSNSKWFFFLFQLKWIGDEIGSLRVHNIRVLSGRCWIVCCYLSTEKLKRVFSNTFPLLCCCLW